MAELVRSEALSEEAVAKLNEVTDDNKAKKYDRQIRLWGMQGQKRIEKAHICLLGAGPTGTETLKNLILPGIGQFTVIDGEKVTNRDLGNNFFVEISGLGASRAEETQRFLQELNSFVAVNKGIEQDPAALINSDPDFVAKYDIIVANNLPNNVIAKLSDACVKHEKVLVTLRSNGMMGIVRLFKAEHRVMEKKNDNIRWDLRLNHPWKELEDFCDGFDMEAYYADIDNKSSDFVHAPFVALLVQAVKNFRSTHNGQLPKTEEEKLSFQKQILAAGREYQHAHNFQEARDNAYLCYVPYSIPSEVRDILNDDKCNNLTADSKSYWILARALKEFIAKEGEGVYLPLPGSLPDISTFAPIYIALQKLYNAKAAQDCEAFAAHVRTLLKSIGRPEDSISEEKIKFFCKQSADLQVSRYTPVSNEFDSTKIQKENIEFWDEKGKWFLCALAAGRFQAEHGRLPGDRNTDALADYDGLKKLADEIVAEFEFEADTIPEAYLRETCRFGGSQIHTTAAYLGGVAAQEIIKILTKQWVPINNTFVYDAISGNGGSFQL